MAEIYNKADTMNALGDHMKQLVEEQKKMLDPNRKDDDSSEESSDDEGGKENQFTFKSAIDVGSHFIDVNPDGQLDFQQYEGHLLTQFTISNPCKTCPIAFFVYTSAPIPVRVVPANGFIPATFSQPIKIAWDKNSNPNVDKLENCMFFVKALPLSPEMDVSESSLFPNCFLQIELMQNHLNEVFNTYNINILFTTHHLPCKVNQSHFNPQ
jgi:hypothetical protein